MPESSDRIVSLPAATSQDVLTSILRDGAQRLLTQAIEAEVAEWIEAHCHLRDSTGHRQVVRNGQPSATFDNSSSPEILTWVEICLLSNCRYRNKRYGVRVARSNTRVTLVGFAPQVRTRSSEANSGKWSATRRKNTQRSTSSPGRRRAR